MTDFFILLWNRRIHVREFDCKCFFFKKTYDIISCGGPTPESQSNAGVNAVDMLWACGCTLVWPFASICVWYYGPGDLVQLRVLAVKDTEFSRSPCLVRLSFGSVVFWALCSQRRLLSSVTLLGRIKKGPFYSPFWPKIFTLLQAFILF